MVNESKNKKLFLPRQSSDVQNLVQLLTKEISWNYVTRARAFFGTFLFALVFHFQAYTWYYLGHDSYRFYNHGTVWRLFC